MQENQDPMRTFMQRIARKPWFVPALIVLGGGAIAFGVIALKPTAVRQTGSSTLTPTVHAVRAQQSDASAQVVTTGTVLPTAELTLTPQVSGKIVARNPKLIPGSFVKQGDMLVQVDPRDYAIVVRQQLAAVRKAELDLEIETGRKNLALREWELLAEGQPDRVPTRLSSRESQIDTVRIAHDAAKAALERAQLDVSRTTLRAPFDAVVVEENIEVGQVVTPQTVVAKLIGTDALWVKVSVPVDMLSFLAIPGMNRDSQARGSEAIVTYDLGQGSDRIERKGHVLRLLSHVDAQTRTAQLLITMPKPFATQSMENQPQGSAAVNSTNPLPLLPGAFVRVTLVGTRIPNTFVIPRAALHQGHTVWIAVARADGTHLTLAPRTVQVRWGDADRVYVYGDLKTDDQVVTSPLTLPVAGMVVQLEHNQ